MFLMKRMYPLLSRPHASRTRNISICFDLLVMLEPTCRARSSSTNRYQKNLFSGVKKYSTCRFSGSGLRILK
jgi:hypothetical protein